MNFKIGYRETASALIIFSLTPALVFLVGRNSISLGSGAWINCIICFVISLILLPVCKMYLSYFGGKNIIQSLSGEYGKTVAFIALLLFIILIFASSALSLGAYTDRIMSLTLNQYESHRIALIVCAVSAICAYLGLEAVTRQSYLILNFSYVIIFVLLMITSKGWNTDNFYPLFGVDSARTFNDCLCFVINIGLMPFLLICNYIRSAKESFYCIRRSVIISFSLCFVLFLIYCATVPYPMGRLFGVSPEAIFASASAGEVLHRFEIFLTSLYMFFSVISLSFLIIAASVTLASFSKSGDPAIYVLINSSVIYNLSFFRTKEDIYPALLLLSVGVSVVCMLLVIASVFVKNKLFGGKKT